MSQQRADHISIIDKTLQGIGEVYEAGLEIIPLSGDGSDRIFYRIVFIQGGERRTRMLSGKGLLFVFPSPSNPKSLLEARACWQIGQHLLEKKVPVPEIFYFDPKSGVIVYEDLGDVLLYNKVYSCFGSPDGQKTHQPANNYMGLYEKTLDILIHFQIYGALGFDPQYCWETPTYSRELMVQRESLYFLEAYCLHYRGLSDYPRELKKEFGILADRVSQESGIYLMHRDFQSRNIMITDGNVRIIDFQGARFGPLGYDLASFLNDPYVQLPHDSRERLLDYYIATIKEHISLDGEAFREGYYHIALQRNLQVIGAFSFLSGVRGKLFFKPYILPALNDLRYKLQGPLKGSYPILAEFVETMSLT